MNYKLRITKTLKAFILKIIRLYQRLISQNLGSHCRFYPSCSEYSYQTIKKYGIFIGGQKGLKRILKCHPWSQGGVDVP